MVLYMHAGGGDRLYQFLLLIYYMLSFALFSIHF